MTDGCWELDTVYHQAPGVTCVGFIRQRQLPRRLDYIIVQLDGPEVHIYRGGRRVGVKPHVRARCAEAASAALAYYEMTGDTNGFPEQQVLL